MKIEDNVIDKFLRLLKNQIIKRYDQIKNQFKK